MHEIIIMCVSSFLLGSLITYIAMYEKLPNPIDRINELQKKYWDGYDLAKKESKKQNDKLLEEYYKKGWDDASLCISNAITLNNIPTEGHS